MTKIYQNNLTSAKRLQPSFSYKCIFLFGQQTPVFLFGKQWEVQKQKINELICWPMVFSFRITISFLPIFFDFFKPKTSPSVLEDYNVVLPIYAANIFFLAVKFTGQCKKGFGKEIAAAWKIKLCSIWAQQDMYVIEKDLTPWLFTKLNFWDVWCEANYQGFNLPLGGKWMEYWVWKAFCLSLSFFYLFNYFSFPFPFYNQE